MAVSAHLLDSNTLGLRTSILLLVHLGWSTLTVAAAETVSALSAADNGESLGLYVFVKLVDLTVSNRDTLRLFSNKTLLVSL